MGKNELEMQELETQISSAFFFNILIAIESIQLLYYSIHPSIKNLFTSNYLKYPQSAIRYFQMDYILKLGNTSLTYTLLIIVCSLIIIILLLSVIAIIKIHYSKRKSSAFLTYSLKTLSFMVLLLITVFNMPFHQVLQASIFCNSTNPVTKNMECFSGAHSIYFGVSIGFFALYLIEICIFSILYLDINPNSKIPFAGPQSKILLIKVFLKMGLNFIFLMDYKGTYSVYVVSGLTFIYLVLLMMRYRNIAYYNKSVNSWTCVCEVTLFWVSLSVLTHILFNDGDSDIGLIYMIIEIPFAAFSFLYLIEKRKFSIVKVNVKNLKKDEDVEIYFNIVRELIEMRDKDSYRIKLEGMLKYYSKNSLKAENEKLCTELSMDLGKDEENSQKVSKWYLLLRSVLLDSIEKFNKSPRLHLLNAYLQHEKLNNKYRAYFELVETTENKPNFQEEFAVFRHKLIIEDEMIEAEMRNSDASGMNVNQMVDFQNKFVVFANTIENAVNLHGDFWRELTEENPDTKKLQNLGSMITNTIEDTRKQYDKLSKINPNHSRCLEIYGFFLKDVVNDENNGQRILDKYQKLNKNFSKTLEDMPKADENSNTCIITVSGNYKNLGTVINVNNEIHTLLGYKKSEVVGEKVESLMPKIFAENHQRLLMRYFNNPSERPLNIIRTVYSMNKKGYVIPCTLTAKILSNLDSGIQIVGFLRRFDVEEEKNFETKTDSNYLLYSIEDGMVYGVTKACYENFGIRASLTYGKCYNMSELKMDHICPEILDSKNQEELKSSNGMIVTIDTAPIQANHPLENENDESVDDVNIVEDEHQEVMQQIEKLKRYKKYKIRARIFSSDQWFDGSLKVNVLKFHEIEGDEYRSGQSISDFGESVGQEDDLDLGVEKIEQSLNEGGSDLNSSIGSVGDNNKDLKEARALISEKNVPKSIKLLNRIFVVFMVCLFGVYGVNFYMFILKNTNMSQSLEAAVITYSRHSMLAETNFYSRKLNLAANDWLEDSTNLVTPVKKIISDKVSKLQKIEFEAFKVEGRLKDKLNRNISTDEIKITQKLHDGTFITQDNPFDDSLFMYIADTYQLAGKTTAHLKNIPEGATNVPNEQQNADRFFSFIIQNGLMGSEDISDEIFQFYMSEFETYRMRVLIVSAAGLVVVVFATCLLIPIVFKVLRTNKMVMSLFGKIKIEHIKELAEKCDKYLENTLSEKKDDDKSKSKKTDIKKQSESFSESKMNHGEGEEFDTKTEKPRGNIADLMSEESNQKKIEAQIMNSGRKQNDSNTASGKKRKREKEKLKKEEETKINGKKRNKRGRGNRRMQPVEEDDEEYDNDEEASNTDKFLNSRDSSRKRIVCLFILMAVATMIPFLVIGLLEVLMYSEMIFLYQHLQVLVKIPSEVKYSLLFAYESLAQKKVIDLTAKNGTKLSAYTYYSGRSYDSLMQMNSAIKESYPSYFDEYKTLYEDLYKNDLCKVHDQIKANCDSTKNSILTNGGTTSVYFLLTNSYQLFITLKNMTDVTDAKVKELIQSRTMVESEEVMVNIAIVFDDIIAKYNISMESYISYTFLVNIIIVVTSAILLLILFLMVWRPYLKNLNNNIWRTKGMLSMIPMKAIQDNKALESAIIEGDLMQAVK